MAGDALSRLKSLFSLFRKKRKKKDDGAVISCDFDSFSAPQKAVVTALVRNNEHLRGENRVLVLENKGLWHEINGMSEEFYEVNGLLQKHSIERDSARTKQYTLH